MVERGGFWEGGEVFGSGWHCSVFFFLSFVRVQEEFRGIGLNWEKGEVEVERRVGIGVESW